MSMMRALSFPTCRCVSGVCTTKTARRRVAMFGVVHIWQFGLVQSCTFYAGLYQTAPIVPLSTEERQEGEGGRGGGGGEVCVWRGRRGKEVNNTRRTDT